MFAFTFTPATGTATIFADGASHSLDSTHPNFAQIKDLLIKHSQAKSDDARKPIEVQISSLIDIPKTITVKSSGSLRVENDTVYYKGQPLHNVVTDRILAIFREGFDISNLLLFLENLMLNPSHRAVNELYDFLSNKGLPITSDGHFLAYKAVRENFTDKHTGKFDHSVGKVVKIERNMVDDDRTHECSNGLHVGALQYVKGFGSVDAGDRFLVCKVNPKDVVSVPRDANFQKIRVCEYEVVDLLKDELVAAVHTEYDRKPEPLNNYYMPDDSQDDYEDSDVYDEEDDWGDDSEIEEDEDDESCDCSYCTAGNGGGGW